MAHSISGGRPSFRGTVVSAAFALCMSVALVLPGAPAFAQGTGDAGIWKINSGFDYSTGKYGGTTSTDIWYVPFSLKYQGFPWSAKLTVPWLSTSLAKPGGMPLAGLLSPQISVLL